MKRTAEQSREYSRIFREKNPEYNRAATAKFRQENPGYNYAQVKKWRAANPWAKKAQHALRRAAKKLAVPQWLSAAHRLEVSQIYKNCPQGFHVDHIVPLLGKQVRGLHVPWNLQYLPATENMKKSNKVAI